MLSKPSVQGGLHMIAFLIDHLPGCTPLKPCASCGAAAFLKPRLSKRDFDELLEIIRGASCSAATPTYSKENPIPLETPISVLGLPSIARNALFRAGVQTIGDLVAKREKDLRPL